MRSILHIGSIAGVPQELSRAQRRLGFRSDILAFQPHQFQYEVDIYRPTRLPIPFKYFEKMLSFSKVADNYDVLHFHWSSVIPFGFDLPLWRRKKKKIVVHHHGDDIRQKGEGTLYAKFADEILVSTPDLLKWSPRAKWIPNPIDLGEFRYVGVKDHPGSLKVVHAPSGPCKGTEHVIKAVEDLKKEGHEVELVLIKNMPHREAVENYKRADIVVDQLLTGWYGVFAIECMALGKPVCVYIREDLEQYLPNTTLVNASPKNIKDKLKFLIEDANLRIETGNRARQFAEQAHNADAIAEYLEKEIY